MSVKLPTEVPRAEVVDVEAAVVAVAVSEVAEIAPEIIVVDARVAQSVPSEPVPEAREVSMSEPIEWGTPFMRAWLGSTIYIVAVNISAGCVAANASAGPPRTIVVAGAEVICLLSPCAYLDAAYHLQKGKVGVVAVMWLLVLLVVAFGDLVFAYMPYLDAPQPIPPVCTYRFWCTVAISVFFCILKALLR